MIDPEKIQQEYYRNSAAQYDEYHSAGQDSEHDISLFFLSSVLELNASKSILDVGAGTGRVMKFLSKKFDHIQVTGLEPVESLREIAYSKGISRNDLLAGDGYSIPFPDNSFDIVSEFGVLHHVKHPEKMLREMIRVSKQGIFISDSNNFGQGPLPIKMMKWALNVLGVWKLFDYLKTGGRGFRVSDTDGLSYSYSVFDSYSLLKTVSSEIYFFNLQGRKGINPFRNAGHIALYARKNN